MFEPPDKVCFWPLPAASRRVLSQHKSSLPRSVATGKDWTELDKETTFGQKRTKRRNDQAPMTNFGESSAGLVIGIWSLVLPNVAVVIPSFID
jgi:hypothetical protein